MTKVLITGGNGFIAKNFLEQSSDKYIICAPDRNELDLLDSKKVLEYIKNNKFDVVIHAATYDAAPAHSGKDPSKVLEYNLRMFFNIARCSDYFDKMIYFGSGAEFDREHWIPNMDETYFDNFVPQDQYGFSKYIMTKYALSNDKIYNLRLFAVFGKYEDPKVRIISSICTNIALNQDIIIKQNKYYDFLYINDLIKIIDWFIENKPKHKVYNICTNTTSNFKEVADKLLKQLNKKLDIKLISNDLGKEYSGNNNLLLEEINFKFSSFDESIIKLYNWIENNKKV